MVVHMDYYLEVVGPSSMEMHPEKAAV